MAYRLFNVDGTLVTNENYATFIGTLQNSATLSTSDLVKIITNTAVGSTFDLETNYTFQSSASLGSCLKILNNELCESPLVKDNTVLHTEVWSLFKTAIQKSTRNLSISAELGLGFVLLQKLVGSETIEDVLADLFTQILCIIVPQSISNAELRLILNHLHVADKEITWPKFSRNLISVLRQAPFQTGPTEFFDFPGLDRSCVAIPPISKWTCSNGFTFSTWLRSDPISDLREDKDKPYVYCFRTAKGQGYSAHFVGACLIVTIIKSKNKGYQYSVNFEFKPRTWYMLTLVHIYSRWRNGEVKCYVDGQLVTTVEVNWYVKSGYDAFDKCYLGWAPSAEEDHVRRYFCGQLGTTYLLSIAMTQPQVEALHQLGPCYTGLFNQQSDTDVCLSEYYKTAIFSQGSLASEVVFSYSARATQCQVCFFSSAQLRSKEASQISFAHSPHAQLQGDVKAVVTQPVYHALHSIGGVQILFPLLTQIGLDEYNVNVGEEGKSLEDAQSLETCPSFTEMLFDLVVNLLMRSSQIRQQMVQLKGLMVISHYLVKYSSKVLTTRLLNQIISLSNYFIHIRSEALLKHTIDFLLLNANLWVYAPVDIQVQLFTYLSTDFSLNCPLFKLSRVRRVSTVLQLLHMLKYHYWVTNPQAKSGVVARGLDSARPSQTDILTIRSLILLFLKAVITVDSTFIDEEHMQSLLNYLTTLNEEENIHDVLSLLLSITANSPKLACQALDRKYAVRAIFKIITSPSERIRIKAVKILIYYMANIAYKRKMDIMISYGLYELLAQRMMLHTDEITLPTYNVMFEFCTEQAVPQIMENKHAEIDSTTPLVNALGLKAIASMLNASRKTLSVFEIKKKFITDMILLFNHNRENRRRLLQCSVWQDWVFSMLHIYPSNERERQITEMVLVLFKILLHHAIKFEYGGWRVWIDTLSIAHFKVAIENYRRSVLGIGYKPVERHKRSPSNASNLCHNHSARNSAAIQNSERGSEIVENESGVTNGHAKVGTPAGPERPIEAQSSSPGVSEVREAAVSSSSKKDLEPTLESDIANMQAQVFLDHVINDVAKEVSNRKESSSNESLKVLGLPQSSINDAAIEGPPVEFDFASTESSQQSTPSRNDLTKTSETANAASSMSADNESISSKEVRFSEGAVPAKTESQTPGSQRNVASGPSNTANQPKPILKVKDRPQSSRSARQPQQDVITDAKRKTRRLFKIPPFQWTHLAKRLLSDLMFAIETDVQVWRSQSSKSIVDFLNATENSIFLHNTVHIISQLSDMILYSSGGLVPLLHSTTSQVQENITLRNGLLFDESFTFVHRLLNLIDVFVYSGSPNFASLENEKRMNPGGILRQCLRLIFWAALKNCLECRYKFARQLLAFENDVKDDVEETTNDVIRPSIQYQAINDFTRLLQDSDVGRIRAAVYRETDDLKQSQTLALSSVYFLTLLMVGRYQDILEPDKVSRSPYCKELMDSAAASLKSESPETKRNREPSVTSKEDEAADDSDKEASVQEDRFEDVDLGTPVHEADDVAPANVNRSESSAKRRQSLDSSKGQSKLSRSFTWAGADKGAKSEAVNNDGADGDQGQGQANDDLGLGIASNMNLDVTGEDGHSKDKLGGDQIEKLSFATPNVKFYNTGLGVNISKSLENSLYGSSHVLRELFLDFSQFLSKTLLGSHGQELLNDGLAVMKNSQSAIELVMMLCSQEWQKAIQKHAGGAFLNLENEGRIIASLTADHLIRVADEANDILNREYQDQMSRQSEFEARCATHLAERREEETMCDRLIVASRRRETIAAIKSVQKVLSSTFSHGIWNQSKESASLTFYKIDTWEDNLRRRRRLVMNSLGSSHPEAVLSNRLMSKESDPRNAYQESGSDPKRTELNIKVQPLSNNEEAEKLDVSETDNDLTSLDENEASESQSSHMMNIPSTANPVKFQSHQCLLIHPCVTSYGMLSITTNELIFDIDEDHPLFKQVDPSLIAYCDVTHIKIPFSEIRAVFARRYLLQNTAIELFVASRSAVMFNLADVSAVRQVISLLPRVGIGTKFGAQQTRRYSMASGRTLFRLTAMTERWQKREISNFQYLMFLNTIAGRTFNDLNQYPVFPWIIKDYDSEDLDLKSPATFRDFTKPIGAQTQERAEIFRKKYENWESDNVPPFHYGTHYSTPGFVLNFLVRCEPFTSLFLSFQGGKFDHPDRTFHSIKQAWMNCQRDTSDVKELIPELFYLPEMLKNKNKLKFGRLDTGETVNDVLLPAWAKSAEDFMRVHRIALESEFVSCQLNHWIDLIFGYKQRGIEAEKAINVFYHLTYDGAVNFVAIKDPVMLEALKLQIKSFGTTPSQLLLEPHPQRRSIIVLNPQLFKELGEANEGYTVKLLSNSPIVHLSANTHQNLSLPACVTIAENLSYAINRWVNCTPSSSVPTNRPSNSGHDNDSSSQRALQIDPVQSNALVNPGFMGRKLSSDLMDTNFTVKRSSFVVTSDNQYCMVCGFWDRSLRVFHMESGKLVQVVFGHYGIVTCVARTECRFGVSCHVVTGSADNTLLVWEWNSRYQCIIGENTIPGEYPIAKAILMGHEACVNCVSACSELGIVVSASNISNILVHLINGEFVRRISLSPNIVNNSHLDSKSNMGIVSNVVLNPASGYILATSKTSLSVFSLEGVVIASLDESSSPEERLTINDVIMSVDGVYTILACNRSIIRILRSHNLETVHDFEVKNAAMSPYMAVSDINVKCVELSWDNRNLIAGLSNGAVWVCPINFTRWYPEYHEQLKSGSAQAPKSPTTFKEPERASLGEPKLLVKQEMPEKQTIQEKRETLEKQAIQEKQETPEKRAIQEKRETPEEQAIQGEQVMPEKPVVDEIPEQQEVPEHQQVVDEQRGSEKEGEVSVVRNPELAEQKSEDEPQVESTKN